MSLDLQSLKFKVDTTELKDAADKLGDLATQVDKLKTSLKNLPKVQVPTVTGGGSSGSSNVSTGSNSPGSARANSNAKTFNSLMEDLTNLQKDLVDGFTRGESSILKQARAIRVTADEMQQLKGKIKEVGELFKDPFDSAIGSMRSVTQEFDRISTRAEMVRNGIYLSTKQLQEFSRISAEVRGQMLAAGKKTNKEGFFEGPDLDKFTQEVKRVQDLYLKQAVINNQLVSQEKLALKESERVANEKARLLIEGERMMQDAVIAFRKNEEQKQAALERTLELTRQLQEKTALLQQGYSRGEATAIVSGTAKGVDRATLDAMIEAQRANANAMGKSATATDGSAKAARELAKANQYLIDVEARLDEALKETNASLDRRSTDQLVKIRNALNVTGDAATGVGSKFDVLRNKVDQVASKEQERKLQYLARAISVQMGDVAISLASGMNPLLVMIQQGDQIRGAIQQAGVEGKALQSAMSNAAVQIATSFYDTGKAIGGFFVSAITGAGTAVTNLGIGMFGATEAIRKWNNSLELSAALGSKFAENMLKVAAAMRVVIGVMTAGLITFLIAAATALYQVIKAEDELTRSLALNAGAMGLNTAAATNYANAMNGVGVSTSKALSIIGEMGKTGNLVASEIALVTKAAADLDHYGNVAIEKTVKTFSDLKKDPVDALIKVAKETGMVSIETIKAVIELEAMGKTTEAAALAMKEYGAVAAKQVAQTKNDYSDFAIFIKTVGKSISDFWDETFKFIWRKASPEENIREQMKAADSAIKEMEGSMSGVAGAVNGALDKVFFGGQWIKSSQQNLEALKKTREELTKNLVAIGVNAKAEEDAAAKKLTQTKLLEEANKLREKGYSKEQKYIQDINKLRESLIKAEGVGDVDSAVVFRGEIARLAKEYGEAVKGKREHNKVEEDGKRIIEQLTGKREEMRAALNGQNKAEQDYQKLLTSQAYLSQPAHIKKVIDALFKEINSLQILTDKKKMDEQATKHLLEQIDKEIEAREKVDDIRRQLWQSSKQLDAALDEETRKLGLQTSLLFASDEVRNKALKTFENEATLRRELLDISKEENKAAAQAGEAGLSNSDRESFENRKAEARERAKLRELNINTEIVNDQMKKWVDMYNNLQSGVAGAISTALFEGGKAGRKKLRDVIVAELRKPIELYIKAGVELLTQGGQGFIQALLGNGSAVASNSNSTSSMINGASAGQKAMEWGSKVYSGYQTGGLSGAWSSGTGGLFSGGSTASSSALATTDIGVGAVQTGAGSIGTAAWTSAGVYALYAAAIYAGVTALTKHLGMAAPRAEASGIQGNFTAGEFSGKAFQDFYQKGGILRKSRWWTDLTELNSEFTNLMNEIGSETRKSIIDYAGTLGLATDQVNSVRTEIKIAMTSKNVKELSDKYGEDLNRPFEELSENGKRIAQSSEFADAIKADQDANLKEIEAAAASYGAAMVATFADRLKPFAKYGEQAQDTMARMSTILKTVNVVFKDLGLTLFDTSLAGAAASQNFIDLFGSVDSFNDAFSVYYENFYTAEEKLKAKTNTLTEAFDKMGIAVPNSTEGFRKMVDAANAAGDTTLVANLVKLAPAFADVQKAIEDVTGKVTSGDVKEAFYGMVEKFFDGDKLKELKVSEVVDQLAQSGIEVSRTMVEGATNADIYSAALDYFNKGMYDKALAVLNITEKLEAINPQIKPEDVISTFSGVADKMLGEKELKDFRIYEIVTQLGKSGIEVSKELVESISMQEVYSAALNYFNSGMYDKAMAILGVVDKLNSAGLALQGDPAIRAAATSYTASKTKLENARDAVAKAYDKQIESVDKNISALQDEVSSREASVEAAQKNVDKFKEIIDKFKEFKNSISDLKSELVADIIGSQGDGKAGALAGLTAAANRAKSGDLSALDDIQKYSKQYVEISKENSGSFLDYARDIMKINSILTGVETSADTQVKQNEEYMREASKDLSFNQQALTLAQGQLDQALEAKKLLESQKEAALSQVDALLDVANGVLSVEQAVINLQGAITGFIGADSDKKKFVEGLTVKTAGGSSAKAQNYSGKHAAGWLQDMINAGYTADQIKETAIKEYGAAGSDVENLGKLLGLPGFASGGYYSGGAAIVGETGPELINFDRPGQVYNARQTQELFSGNSASNSRVEALLQMLLNEISKSRSDNSKVRQILERLTPEGDSLVVRFSEPQDVNVLP